MTLEAALTTAVTSLGGVVIYLAVWANVRFNAQEAKLKDCEDDREKLWEKIASLTGEAMSILRCPKDDCPNKASFSILKKKQSLND